MSTEEYRKTEKPLMGQLKLMGWTTEDGDTEVPYLSGGCESFEEVFLKDDLRDALRRLNRHKGSPWLDEGRIDQAVYELERVASPNLMESNQEATHLLRKGTTVEGYPELHDGKNQTVRYIDFAQPPSRPHTDWTKPGRLRISTARLCRPPPVSCACSAPSFARWR